MWSFRSNCLLEPVDVTVANLMAAWHQYSLGVLVYAYCEFEEQVGELAIALGAKSRAVRLVIETFGSGETFVIADLERACPGVSRATIWRVWVPCVRRGRSSAWARDGRRGGRRHKRVHEYVKRAHPILK